MQNVKSTEVISSTVNIIESDIPTDNVKSAFLFVKYKDGTKGLQTDMSIEELIDVQVAISTYIKRELLEGED